MISRDIEVDILPDGLHLHATSITLRASFHYEPAQPASFCYPPLPSEAATVEIEELLIKSKFSSPGIPDEWETAPRCLDEMVETILLSEMADE